MATLTSFLRGSKSSLSTKSSRSNLSNKSNVSNGSVDMQPVPNGSDAYLVALQEALMAQCFELTRKEEWNKAWVLDVGCGKGDTTRQLAEKVPEIFSILGVDSDSSSIDQAFVLHADERLDFANVDVEDSKTFELKWGGRFDWMFSAHALLWAREQSVALRNLMWCLRPGGRCFIAVPAGKPPDLHTASVKIITSSAWKKYFETSPELVSELTDNKFNRLWFHHPNADRVYSALLEQVGYQVLKTKQYEFKYTFPTEDDYRECIKALMQKAVDLLPENKKSLFLKELLKISKKKCPKAKDGKLSWTINYVVVIAKRPEL